MHFVCRRMHQLRTFCPQAGIGLAVGLSEHQRSRMHFMRLFWELDLFSVFFLLREVHTAAYGSLWNRALVLLPIGIGASSARRNQKCIRILADSRRNRPPMKSIRFRPSLIPLDAQAVFCSCMPFFGPPLTGFRAWDEVVGTGAAPWRRSRRGFAFQAVTSTEIEKRLGDVIVFSDDSIRPTATPQGGPQAIHRPQATSDPLSGPLEIRTGSGFQWRNQARLHNSFTFMRPYALRMQPYAVRMHFLPASKKLGGSRAE